MAVAGTHAGRGSDVAMQYLWFLTHGIEII